MSHAVTVAIYSYVASEPFVAVRALLAARKKIAAIKLYREHTGVGLKDAKDAVETIERGHTPVAPVAPLTDPQSVEEILRRGNKIAAIKRYREETGSSLKEAKDAVEEIERVQRSRA